MSDRDKMNMDSPYFDSEICLNQTLSSCNVSDLVNKCNELQIDIRSYDQDIQGMVFENYSKFITSIETVKKMKDDIEKVDDKLKVLEESISRINDSAIRIDSSLKTKRKEIQRLDTINNDLQRLRILCEIPKVSKYDLLEYKNKVTPKTVLSSVNFDEIFGQTIEHFSVCGRELIKFQNTPLIKPIYNDAIGYINEISDILWNLQNTVSLSEENLRKITSKLVVVAKDEGLALKNYVSIVKDRIKRKIKELFDDSRYSSENFYKIEEEETQKYLAEKNYDIQLEDFEAFKQSTEISIYNDPDKIAGSYIKMMKKFSENVIRDIIAEITYLNQEMSQTLEKIGASQQTFDKIDAFTKEIIIFILQKVSDKLTQKKVSNYEVNECLKLLNKDLTEILGIKEDKNLKRAIIDKFSENIELIVRGQVMNSFTGLRNNFIKLMIDLKSKSTKVPDMKEENDDENVGKEINDLLNLFKNRFHVHICNTLIELKTFISSTDNLLQSQMVFMSLLHTQYVEFMKNIAKLLFTRSSKVSVDFLKTTNVLFIGKSEEGPQNLEYGRIMTELTEIAETSAFFILQIQILDVIEGEYLNKSFEALFSLFQADYSSLDTDTRAHYINLKSMIQEEEMPAIMEMISKEKWRVYFNYCEYYYEEATLQFDTYFEKSFMKETQEPRDVTKQIEKISILMNRMFLELRILFPDEKRSLFKKDSFLKKKVTHSDMDKMLARKTRMFERVDINRNTVILTITKCLLKTFLDKSRRYKYNKFGFQQLQVDAYFLSQVALDMSSFGDEDLMIGYYYEIMDSLKETSFEYANLDYTIIETISNVRRQKLSF